MNMSRSHCEKSQDSFLDSLNSREIEEILLEESVGDREKSGGEFSGEMVSVTLGSMKFQSYENDQREDKGNLKTSDLLRMLTRISQKVADINSTTLPPNLDKELFFGITSKVRKLLNPFENPNEDLEMDQRELEPDHTIQSGHKDQKDSLDEEGAPAPTQSFDKKPAASLASIPVSKISAQGATSNSAGQVYLFEPKDDFAKLCNELADNQKHSNDYHLLLDENKIKIKLASGREFVVEEFKQEKKVQDFFILPQLLPGIIIAIFMTEESIVGKFTQLDKGKIIGFESFIHLSLKKLKEQLNEENGLKFTRIYRTEDLSARVIKNKEKEHRLMIPLLSQSDSSMRVQILELRLRPNPFQTLGFDVTPSTQKCYLNPKKRIPLQFTSFIEENKGDWSFRAEFISVAKSRRKLYRTIARGAMRAICGEDQKEEKQIYFDSFESKRVKKSTLSSQEECSDSF